MQSIPEDEIDLGNIGRRVKTVAVYPVSLWRNNIKTTLLFILAGILLAVAFKYATPKVYRSSFVIRPVDRTEKFHLKMINDIHSLLKIRDFKSISSELKINGEAARSIVKIEAYNPYAKNKGDSVNYTEVTIYTHDYNQLINLQRGILSYLENNPYFRKIAELQKKQVEQSLELVEKDLERLDKLKQLQIESYGRSGAGNQNLLPLNDLIDPTQVYSMAAERMNRKAGLMAQMQFLDNFQLVKSCVVVKHAHWPPRIMHTCLVTVPLALLLCFIFLHYKNNRVR
jgi:hypothetical protein